ncbi:zinc-binding dehydrogenase [Conyzicola nivalis]|uniref:NADPH:quinone reductase n=1 Tax=Conyzicola nivalis TaxID=1477021 RepID=A0A916SPR6_9MICO|nr:medium chain dehydrogenase/reductase family protein [Conyzicola nivalis]GGB07561.1 NADPH:quinone reductase [Conyzicola nivalis]
MNTVTALEVVLPGLVEPSGLLLRERPLPAPERGQLLVAVEATGISFAEKSMRRGLYFGQPAFPFVPGYDLVGRVLAVGSERDSALVGTRVASVTKVGGWASHAIVAARDSVPVPDGLAPADVETVVVNGLTAWQMLHRKARVRAGQTVVVHGANSGVGGILVQLARHEGIRVIGTASPRHHDALRAQGVEPLDYNDPRLLERVLELSPGGVAAVFDNVGGEMVKASWRMLARGGSLVRYSIIADVSGLTGSLAVPFMKALARTAAWNLLPNGRRASFYDLWAGHRMHPTTFRLRLRKDLGRVFALLGDGTIKANIAATFPLSEASDAMELAESRTINGKVILVP